MSTSLHTTTKRSRRSAKPADELRSMLNAIQKGNPAADWIAVVNIFTEEHIHPKLSVLDDPEDSDRFTGALREWALAQDPSPRSRGASPEAKAEREQAKAVLMEEIEAKDGERIVEEARRLLEWEVMNGRQLGDLTGTDCRNLADRMGGFFHKLAEVVPPRGKVRAHFSELQIQGLARRHRLMPA